MGCCGCFGFSSRKPKKALTPYGGMPHSASQESLLDDDVEDEDDGSYNGDMTETGNPDEDDFHSPTKRSEEILMSLLESGMICREFPVKESSTLIRSEVRCRKYLCVFIISFQVDNSS